MKVDNLVPVIQPLQSLPRDKKTLDFILKKLTVNSSPERHEVLAELLEMHRTSIGFDPFILSKGRFKRFRSAEIRQVLVEIEQDLNAITTSVEYLLYLEESARHQALIEQYINIVSQLTAPPTKELNDQVDHLIVQLEREGAHELLLSFFRQAEKHFLSRTKDLEKIIDTYASLLLRLAMRNNLLLSGLQTALLLQKALRANASQEELLLHFNCLTELHGKTDNKSENFELLQQLVRIGLNLDHRVMHITPFLKLVDNNTGEIKPDDPKHQIELLAIVFIYDTTCDTAERIKNLDLLVENVKGFDDKQPLVFIKYGKALLEAENGYYADAIRILNEAEHLLYRNGFKSNAKKEWIEICILRFYIYILNEKINHIVFENTTYDGIIQMLRDALSDHSALNATIFGLKGVKEYVKGNSRQAEYYLTTAIEEVKNPPVKYNHNIFKALLESNTENINLKKLNKTRKELVALQEPFYSTILAGLLKTA